MFNESIGSVATEEIGFKTFLTVLRVLFVSRKCENFLNFRVFVQNLTQIPQWELPIGGFGSKFSHLRREG